MKIIDLEKEEIQLPKEHRDLLEERLRRIEDGKAIFKIWENIKGKYQSSFNFSCKSQSSNLGNQD
ncbi:MAG: addiction module protein [Bacteroidales bacterium]|nr:addiction module protein [Bacteroidales bacterium]